MKRLAAVTAVLGALLIGAGFAYDSVFTGAPAPDPTPELAARSAHHTELAAWIGRSGLALLVAAAGLGMFQAGLRRLRRR